MQSIRFWKFVIAFHFTMLKFVSILLLWSWEVCKTSFCVEKIYENLARPVGSAHWTMLIVCVIIDVSFPYILNVISANKKFAFPFQIFFLAYNRRKAITRRLAWIVLNANPVVRKRWSFKNRLFKVSKLMRHCFFFVEFFGPNDIGKSFRTQQCLQEYSSIDSIVCYFWDIN